MTFPARPTDTQISLIRTTPPTPAWLDEALRQVLQGVSTSAGMDTLLRYHRFGGLDYDKETAALWLSRRFEEPPAPERIIITNGAQSALFLTLATAVGRDGLLLVEEYSYYGLRRLADLLGIEVRGIAMDGDGALPDAFAQACREGRPTALFVTPTIHNPTTYVMSHARRVALVDVARRHNAVIIEDDVYGPLAANAPPPMAVLGPDVTWHATSLAKCIAPGLKVGFLVAPSTEAAAAAMTRFQVTSTWHAAPLSAVIAGTWLRDGMAARILEAVREEASERQALAARLLRGARFASNPHALHAWLEIPTRWTETAFIEAARGNGVVLRPGSMFAVDTAKTTRSIRVVFGSPETRAELEIALSALAPLAEAA